MVVIHNLPRTGCICIRSDIWLRSSTEIPTAIFQTRWKSCRSATLIVSTRRKISTIMSSISFFENGSTWLLKWDETGDRLYETGVDHGVLYIPNESGVYDDGVAWNGLTTVTESPAGADANAQYADNIKYLNLLAAETFGGTIEAFTYPDEFGRCDGTAEPTPGVAVGQQGRHVFGLCYRSLLGNDLEGIDHGYKLHMIYGALAAPSEKAYATINDSPAAIAFS